MEQLKIIFVENALQNEIFWHEKDAYIFRDTLYCDDFLGKKMTEQNAEYFLQEKYRKNIEHLCARDTDRAKKVLFMRGEELIGFALYCVYASEDGKCFVLDFCILPHYRNKGLGKECFKLMRGAAEKEGACYYELNTHCKRSMHFWESLGFVYNGYDRFGSILLLLKDEDDISVDCQKLMKEDEWQILNLLNGYKKEIGEPFLSEEQQEKLSQAIVSGAIEFFVAKRLTRAVAMCSLSRIFSTFDCGQSAIFEDFFVEPAFRKKGCARTLVNFVKSYAAQQDITTLLVGCAQVDSAMYNSLGFNLSLGNLSALHIK